MTYILEFENRCYITLRYVIRVEEREAERPGTGTPPAV